MIKNLFIIDGAAATGKTELVKFLKDKYTSHENYINLLKKQTTREKRDDEDENELDLIPLSKEEFEDLKKEKDFKHYRYGSKNKKEQYGFYLKDIENSIKNYTNTFIIIRNVPLSTEITKLFDNVRIILVYIYADEDKIRKRLMKNGYDEEQIKVRLDRIKPAWDDFITFNESYHEVIINNSSSNDFKKSIMSLLKYYNTDKPDFINISYKERYLLLPALKGYRNNILKKISETNFEKNIFLMMKYRPENKEVYEYIYKIICAMGYNCVRADELEKSDWNITNGEVVYLNPLAAIYCCKYGIALFDEPEVGNTFSPNVAYELGVMHLQQKECLIIKHKSLPTMPFDILGNLFISYDKEIQLEGIIKTFIINIGNK